MSIVSILRGFFVFLRPLKPIVPEEFHRVRCSDGPATAAEIVRRTIFVAPPADSFRVFGMNRNACHTKPAAEFRAGAPFRLRWTRGPKARGRWLPRGRVPYLQ